MLAKCTFRSQHVVSSWISLNIRAPSPFNWDGEAYISVWVKFLQICQLCCVNKILHDLFWKVIEGHMVDSLSCYNKAVTQLLADTRKTMGQSIATLCKASMQGFGRKSSNPGIFWTLLTPLVHSWSSCLNQASCISSNIFDLLSSAESEETKLQYNTCSSSPTRSCNC